MSKVILVGDTVRTLKMMFFVEASHPSTGEDIETQFHKGQSLLVVGVDETEQTIYVGLADGFVAMLDFDDVEAPV